MLALFCLRLAFGMLAALLLLSPSQINPRFYRTHYASAYPRWVNALVLLAINARERLELAGDYLAGVPRR